MGYSQERSSIPFLRAGKEERRVQGSFSFLSLSACFMTMTSLMFSEVPSFITDSNISRFVNVVTASILVE